MRKFSLALLLGLAAASAALTDCGGGGGSTPPIPTPTIAATAKPTAAPSAAPSASVAPSATPTPAPTFSAAASPTPTASPTAVPLALRVIGGAPTTATVAQLQSVGRIAASARRAQSAQGVANGLPILVESSGMVAAWAGDVGVWTTNAQTQANIAETGLTVTPSGSLPINNPGPQPLSCLASTSAICVVHPTAWTFGTSSANGKPVGQQTITVTFADGTTGTTYDDVYDGFVLACNGGFVYQGGIPVATTTKAASDVYADCGNSQISFPHSAIVLANPTSDQYGRTETIMPTLLAQPLFIAAIGNVSFSSIGAGMVFGIQTNDGGYAKVYFANGAGVAVNAATGMALHSNVSGAFDF